MTRESEPVNRASAEEYGGEQSVVVCFFTKGRFFIVPLLFFVLLCYFLSVREGELVKAALPSYEHVESQHNIQAVKAPPFSSIPNRACPIPHTPAPLFLFTCFIIIQVPLRIPTLYNNFKSAKLLYTTLTDWTKVLIPHFQLRRGGRSDPLPRPSSSALA